MNDELKWNEEDHPRDEGGRFASGGGGGGGDEPAAAKPGEAPSNARAVFLVDAASKPSAQERDKETLRQWREELRDLAAASESGAGPKLQAAMDRLDELIDGKKPRRRDDYAYGFDGSHDDRPREAKAQPPGAHALYR